MIGSLSKRKTSQEGERRNIWLSHVFRVTIFYFLFFFPKLKPSLNVYRYSEVIGKHLEESVLLNLPDNYQSLLRQSTTSEEDDMGNAICFPGSISLPI